MNDSNSLPAITDHFIIGIGASAGGLEPIHELFDNMPLNTNFSFVIVQHLSPDHKSLMGELLSRHTSMRIIEQRRICNSYPIAYTWSPAKK